MTFDFRASQLRTSKIIASGSTGTPAQLLLYPISSQGSPLNQGNIDPVIFNTGSIGQDVFVYISGAIGGINGTNHGITLFGGDVYSSGNLKAEQDINATNIYASNTLSGLNVRGNQFYGDNTPEFYFFINSFHARFNVKSGYSGGIVDFKSQGNISFQDGSDFSGSLSSSLSANRTWQLPDASGDVTLTNRVLNGPNITVNTYSNGYVAISSSASPVTGSIFNQSGAFATTTASVAFDSSGRYPSGLGTDVWWFVSGSSTKKALFQGPVYFSSSIILLGGLSGSLQTLTNGTPAFLSGPFINVTTQSNGAIAISSSLTFSAGPYTNINSNASGLIQISSSLNFRAGPFVTINANSNGNIDISSSLSFVGGNFTTVNSNASGLIGISSSLNFNAGRYMTVNTNTNGNIGISSSLYFVAGPNITINDNAGTIGITGSARPVYELVAAYNSTTMTSSVVIGQFAYVPTEVPSASIILRTIVSTVTASNAAYLKLYNITSGSYVCIGGGSTTTLSSSATTATKLESVNLATTTNWSTGSSIYQLEVYSSSSSYPAVFGSSQIIFS